MVPEPTEDNADLILRETGSDYYFFCCSQLVTAANSSGYLGWNGTLYMRIVANSPVASFRSYFEGTLRYISLHPNVFLNGWGGVIGCLQTPCC